MILNFNLSLIEDGLDLKVRVVLGDHLELSNGLTDDHFRQPRTLHSCHVKLNILSSLESGMIYLY